MIPLIMTALSLYLNLDIDTFNHLDRAVAFLAAFEQNVCHVGVSLHVFGEHETPIFHPLDGSGICDYARELSRGGV